MQVGIEAHIAGLSVRGSKVIFRWKKKPEQTTAGGLLPVCSWECELGQVMVRDTLSRCKAQDEHQAPNVLLENRELL